MQQEVFSWGRAFRRHTKPKRLGMMVLNRNESCIPVGNRRSYNDAAMADVSIFSDDRMIEIDENEMSVRVSAGVTLEKLIEKTLEYELMPVVLPGTAKITVGGAIASNVHGKNHHVHGSFCDHVTSMRVFLSEGREECTVAGEDLFVAMCGSFGLIGIVIEATMRLQRIPGRTIVSRKTKMGLEQIVESLRKDDATYTVAWLDTSNDEGRGIYISGEWSGESIEKRRQRRVTSPTLPSLILGSSCMVKSMARVYYHLAASSDQLEGFNSFFFPLDAIEEWDKAFGKQGMIQVQVVLPESVLIVEWLRHILGMLKTHELYSFVTVLKRFGDEKCSRFFGTALNFQIPGGYTLAMDFSASPAAYGLARQITAFAHCVGGRSYLAKDAVMGKEELGLGYGEQLHAFAEVKKRYDAKGLFRSDLSKRVFDA